MKNEYTYINIKDIKVGDTVGVLQNVRVGFGYQYYRHQYAQPETIMRITPKKTKLVGNSDREYSNKTEFVVLDDYARSENEKVDYFRSVSRNFLSLHDISTDTLSKISDEELLVFGKALSTVQSILKKHQN